MRTFASALAGTFVLIAGASAAPTLVDFDDLTQGSTSGFTSNGVVFNVSGGQVNIEPPNSAFVDSTIPNVVTPNNSQLAPALGSVPERPQVVSFDYFDQGGTVGLGVNGSIFTASDFVTLIGSNTWPDANVTVDGTATSGEVTVVFENDNLLLSGMNVFGQETQFDNFLFTPVPEPATLSLLALGGLGLMRRR